MTSRTSRYGLPALAALLLLAGVAADSVPAGSAPAGAPPPGAGAAARLVAFSSCTQLAASLRGTAAPSAGRYPVAAGAPQAASGSGVAQMAGAAAPAGAASGAGPAYSVTTANQAGIDEPDIVKTDGRWIVTVGGGMLRVVDASTRLLTGSLDLSSAVGTRPAADLLLDGDHVLVLAGGPAVEVPGVASGGAIRSPGYPPVAGLRLLLVDLSGGQPRQLASYAMAGTLVDARQDGGTVRVVVGTQPGYGYGPPGSAPGGPGGPAMSTAGGTAGAPDGVSSWLPRYRSESGGAIRTGAVPCASVSRPVAAASTKATSAAPLYSGASLVTVLTFHLGGASLGTGDPVSVVGDGQVVYATGTSLYLAGTTWSAPTAGGQTGPATTVYQFDTSGTGRPRYVASGVLPGTLINQYALSEWQGYLRVATTTQPWVLVPVPGGPAAEPPLAVEPGGAAPGAPATTSAVYVLRRSGAALAVAGRVLGLGRGERIYAVRFVGPAGYVVTFRQTDPLYTLDLRDPRRPRVAGELRLTGYSAYLREIGGDRLIGIGQAADSSGATQGTQVSLFDVADPADPVLLARYQIPGGWSVVEADPHAFLYWAPASALVIPVTMPAAGSGTVGDAGGAAVGGPVSGGAAVGGPVVVPPTVATVLGVGAAALSPRGTLAHPGGAAIERSLVTGGTLWTLSAAGLLASDLSTLRPLAWIAF